MKKQSFVISAIILAMGGFFAKAIGAIYKIPLTNILGSNGIGLYYLVFPVYSLIIVICSSGLSVALTTQVAKCRKYRQRHNEQVYLRVSLLLSFFVSLGFTILILLFSSKISFWQGNVNANIAYIAISPSIIISSIISTLRGYFQGIENMIPTTISLIIEQIIKLTIGLILAHRLCSLGIEYAVLGAILGVTISEIGALIIIAINFITYKGQLDYNYRNKFFRSKRKSLHSILKKSKLVKVAHSRDDAIIEQGRSFAQRMYKVNKSQNKISSRIAIRNLLKMAIPTTLSSIIIPVSTLLDSFMVINLLTYSGYSSQLATSLYGLWGGVVQSLISLPTIIISALTTSMVPALSGLVVEENINEIKNRVVFFIKLTLVLSLLMFVLFFVYAEDIIHFLFGDGLNTGVIDEVYYATKMLRISAISIVYYALLQTFSTILQTMGKSHIPFLSMFISLIVRTLGVYVLVREVNINIFGGIIANIIFLSIATIILSIYIVKYVDIQFSLINHLLLPVIIAGVMLVLSYFAQLSIKYIMNYFYAMVITGGVTITIFCIWVYFSKVFTIKEKQQFNFKKKRIMKNSGRLEKETKF